MISQFDLPTDHTLILKNTVDYLYISPHELLKPYISNYTITFPHRNLMPESYMLIPDASGTISCSFDGNFIKNDIWGATTKISSIGSEVNRIKMLLLIEFHPIGLNQFTGIHQAELAGLRLPLEIVDKNLHIRIHGAVEQAASINDLARKLNSIFLSRMGSISQSISLSGVAGKIIESRGLLSVKELSVLSHYSERHLNRIFYQHIGINIKLFSRLVRINHTIRLLKNSQSTLTQVAQQTGFYDQAHFVKDFESICNVSPRFYLENMSDFYNETLKL